MSYWDWITQIRTDLFNLPDTSPDQDARNFFQSYRFHQPTIAKLPDWPAFKWTLSDLRTKAGNEQVQAQIGRNADPDYEIKSDAHRKTMSFNYFLNHVEHGQANNCYMTARDTGGRLTSILAPDLRPMPSFLTDQPEAAFYWIGRATMTPLHHDTMNLVMCQIMGRKQVRMVAPEHWARVDHKSGVHTKLGWLSDEIAAERGIPYRDFWISPGDAVFIPAGHWHCVRTDDVSITATFTNFVWQNEAHKTFAPVS